MKTIALSILLAAGAVLAAPAFAQDSGGSSSSYTPDAMPTDTGAGERGSSPTSWGVNAFVIDRTFDGVKALEAGNFAEAEAILVSAVKVDRNNADANLYLGVTRMNLGKWDEAKANLQVALRRNPKHPDPKSRLGVTYARLGDVARANALRADLVKMQAACKADCKLSPFIADGIRMIDEALAEPRSAIPTALG